MPPIPGMSERWGETILHCPYCHGYEVRDRPLGVIAAHPMSALDGVRLADGRFVAVNAVFTAPKTSPATSLAAMPGCIHEDGPARP